MPPTPNSSMVLLVTLSIEQLFFFSPDICFGCDRVVLLSLQVTKHIYLRSILSGVFVFILFPRSLLLVAV